MPFKSEEQRRYLHAKHPEIAARWEREKEGAKRVAKKKLTPINKRHEPIFKSADPEFNYVAARKAYDLIMKMDADEAEMFISIVASDIVEETIEKNLRTVQGQVDRIIAKRMQMVKTAMIRKAADNPEVARPYAQAMSDISKANPYTTGAYQFRESDFSRDPSTGQFKAKFKHTQVKPLNRKTQAAMGIPEKTALTAEQKAQYHDEYQQLANFLGAVASSEKNPGDMKVLVQGFDRKNNEPFHFLNAGSKPDVSNWNPKDHVLTGAIARPDTLTAAGAYFGLATSLGGDPLSERNRMITQGINHADQNFGSFAENWSAAASNDYNTNARTYSRIQQGSKLAGEFAPPGSKLQMASAFGEFVGSHGAEAEKVFGPSARRTAYRYRGTEKTPERELAFVYNRAINDAKMANAGDPYRGTREGSRANLKAPQDLSPSQMAQAKQQTAERAPDWEERTYGKRAVAEYLAGRKLPDKNLYGLQLASGNTPPSEGVIINRQGQIVTQAVGYGDDHYLPFNLKNLKGLKGGEYVRTRSVGGLTSEDIYAGLISGARRVTVVSRSGTFEMEFQEDFRGGRRHNDKARRMTRRYEQILDAVQSEKVTRQGVDQRTRKLIADRVKEENPGEKPDVIRRKTSEAIEEYKQNPELSPEDEKVISELWFAARQSDPSRDAKEFRREVTAEIMARKDYLYRLNGSGYASALKALEEQFPYYIRVDSKIQDEQSAITEREKDKGYVEPNRVRPTQALHGWYGTEINQGQKRGTLAQASASRADYQRGMPGVGGYGFGDNGRFTARDETPKDPDKQDKDGRTSTTPQASDEAKRKLAEGMQKLKHREAADQIRDELMKVKDSMPTLVAEQGWVFDPEAYGVMMGSPDGGGAMNKVVAAIEPKLSSHSPEMRAAVGKWKMTAGAVGPSAYDPTLASTWNPRPWPFKGPAYEAKADFTIVEAERRKVSGEYGTPLTGAHSSLGGFTSESELKSEFNAIKAVRQAQEIFGDALRESKADELRKEVAKAQLQEYDQGAAVKMLQLTPEQIGNKMEKIHRMRLLLVSGAAARSDSLSDAERAEFNAMTQGFHDDPKAQPPNRGHVRVAPGAPASEAEPIGSDPNAPTLTGPEILEGLKDLMTKEAGQIRRLYAKRPNQNWMNDAEESEFYDSITFYLNGQNQPTDPEQARMALDEWRQQRKKYFG